MLDSKLLFIFCMLFSIVHNLLSRMANELDMVASFSFISEMSALVLQLLLLFNEFFERSDILLDVDPDGDGKALEDLFCLK